jgi:hypothetical protein
MSDEIANLITRSKVRVSSVLPSFTNAGIAAQSATARIPIPIGFNFESIMLLLRIFILPDGRL